MDNALWKNYRPILLDWFICTSTKIIRSNIGNLTAGEACQIIQMGMAAIDKYVGYFETRYFPRTKFKKVHMFAMICLHWVISHVANIEDWETLNCKNYIKKGYTLKEFETEYHAFLSDHPLKEAEQLDYPISRIGHYHRIVLELSTLLMVTESNAETVSEKVYAQIYKPRVEWEFENLHPQCKGLKMSLDALQSIFRPGDPGLFSPEETEIITIKSPLMLSGSGANGVVFYIRDEYGECVSVKMMRNRENESYIPMECDTVLRLQKQPFDHPNVVIPKYYGYRYMEIPYFTDLKIVKSVRLVIIMDYFPGKPLADINPSILSEQERMHIFRGMIANLFYLHSRGFVHRDVKLDNMMYDPETRKLCMIDFNTLTDAPESHHLVNNVGAECFRAPETVNSTDDYPLSVSSWMAIDVWALGICLCWVFGILKDDWHPYYKDNWKIPTKRLLEPLKDTSPLVYFVLYGMLQKDPKERWTINEVFESV